MLLLSFLPTCVATTSVWAFTVVSGSFVRIWGGLPTLRSVIVRVCPISAAAPLLGSVVVVAAIASVTVATIAVAAVVTAIPCHRVACGECLESCYCACPPQHCFTMLKE